MDTTPLGRVLGEVMLTGEEVDPHAATVANTISAGTPKTFLINVNISPSLKLDNGWPEVARSPKDAVLLNPAGGGVGRRPHEITEQGC